MTPDAGGTIRPGGGSSGRFTLAVLLVLVGLGAMVLFAVVASDDDDGDTGAESATGTAGPVLAAAPVANVQVGEETDAALIQTATTPVVAVNPTDADNVVVGYRIERPQFSCAVQTSSDGGRSFDPGRLDLPAGTERCYTTSLAFDGSGTLHLAFVTLAGVGNVPSAGWITRSTDGGRTFAAATQVLDKERFMLRLAVDPSGRRPAVHLTWVEPAGIGTLQMTPPAAVMAATSTDGGATFGEPVRVSTAGRELVGAPVPVVGKDGALHVLFYDYKDDRFDFQNLEGSFEGTIAAVLATSTDGGKTFSEHVVDDRIVPPEPFLVFTPPFPALAAHPDTGALYAAWSDGRSGEASVVLATSEDGRTWTAPRRVDDGTGAAYLPQLAVAETGRLDVVFAAVAEGAGGPTEIRFTASDDGGRTFGPVRALNEPFDRDLLPRSPRRGGEPDFGSALGLVSGPDGAHVAWPDTRRGAAETFRTDIVAAPVEIKKSGAAARTTEPVPGS